MDNIMFEPKFRIFDDGNEHIVISFDGNSGIDANRTSQVFRFPNSYSQIFVEVEGFNDASQESDSGIRTVEGKIQLKVTGENKDYSFDLAVPKLIVLPEERRSKKAARHGLADMNIIGSIVKQSVSEAFSLAFEDYYQAKLAQKAPMIANNGYIYPHLETNLDKGDNKSFKRSLILSIIIPCIIFTVVWGITMLLSNNQGQNVIFDENVMRSMQNDSRSYEAQVELTKETLRSMGLDPGQSGDLGCLAPQ